MDNQNENNNDFYYGNDDVNAADNAPETVAEETYSQTSQETQEPQPEAANPYGQPNYSGQSYGQQSYGQPYNPYGMPNEAPKKNTCGIISMILGILSVVLACCCYYLAIPLGVASVILGIVSMKKQESTKGFAIAGIILGCVGFIFAVVTVISAIYMQESGMYDEIMRQYMDALGIDNY
ncbi:MAG: DUF4190 domain-containing protein [Lachnospiraceae bacterium]|jgi:hypothetical protein